MNDTTVWKMYFVTKCLKYISCFIQVYYQSLHHSINIYKGKNLYYQLADRQERFLNKLASKFVKFKPIQNLKSEGKYFLWLET